MNTQHHRTQWRAKWPNTYQLPGITRASNDRRHRDIMQRAKDFPSDDYYLSPYDGHLAKLFVQSTQAIYDANPNSTWRRTFIRNQSPFILQVANWVLHSLPTDDREVQSEHIVMMGLKWIPSCAAILLLVRSISHRILQAADPLSIRCSFPYKLLEKFATKVNTILYRTNSGDTHTTRGTHMKVGLKRPTNQKASFSLRLPHNQKLFRRQKAHSTPFWNDRLSRSTSAFSRRHRVWRH